MVSVRALSHSFGERKVLTNINLEVPKGALVAIMGTSGGGKTTLLRCISGLIQPTQGNVFVDGVDVHANPDEARRHMGMVFQGAALFDYMTVWENVMFGLRRHRKDKPAALEAVARETLKVVGLEGSESLMPSELSGGMRKRAGLARALVLDPDVMLYDEPTTGLDPVTTYTIDRLIVDVRNRRGITSLIVSHDLTSVVRVAERVAFLHQGELVYVGDPAGMERSGVSAIEELIRKSQATGAF
jgi:phospholipid/cholesterol/gamma-HCH transport system ATP-binding protein